MPLYGARYRLPNGDQAMTQCYARDPEHLRETLQARRMGEIGEPGAGALPAPIMPSEHLRMGNPREALHAAIWVGMIATRAHPEKAWDLLCDIGPIHELSHLVIGAGTFRQAYGYDDELLADLDHLERTTPGVHPSWGGERRNVAAVEDLVLARNRERRDSALREDARRLQVALSKEVYRPFSAKRIRILPDT